MSGSFLICHSAVVQHQGALVSVKQAVEIHGRVPSSVSGSARLSAAGAYKAIASDTLEYGERVRPLPVFHMTASHQS